MVLHIALEGIDGVGKSTMVDKLMEFFTKKSYKCRKAVQPVNTDIIRILQTHNLLNHEIALLMAFDRSFSYYGENWEQYDLVIWDRSILSSYVYNTDEKTNNQFIKDINRYFPPMDLYIIITTDTILDEQDYTNTSNLIQKYERISQGNENITTVSYIKDKPNEVFESIVQKCFEHLPRCNWCGRFFTKSTKNKKYCSRKCRDYSRQEQNRENNRAYYNRYKDTLTERTKGALGSKNANLHGKRDKDFEKERIKVQKAKKSLGLR